MEAVGEFCSRSKATRDHRPDPQDSRTTLSGAKQGDSGKGEVTKTDLALTTGNLGEDQDTDRAVRRLLEKEYDPEDPTAFPRPPGTDQKTGKDTEGTEDGYFTAKNQ